SRAANGNRAGSPREFEQHAGEEYGGEVIEFAIVEHSQLPSMLRRQSLDALDGLAGTVGQHQPTARFQPLSALGQQTIQQLESWIVERVGGGPVDGPHLPRRIRQDDIERLSRLEW